MDSRTRELERRAATDPEAAGELAQAKARGGEGLGALIGRYVVVGFDMLPDGSGEGLGTPAPEPTEPPPPRRVWRLEGLEDFGGTVMLRLGPGPHSEAYTRPGGKVVAQPTVWTPLAKAVAITDYEDHMEWVTVNVRGEG